jgi:hypothetical protein
MFECRECGEPAHNVYWRHPNGGQRYQTNPLCSRCYELLATRARRPPAEDTVDLTYWGPLPMSYDRDLRLL